MSSDITTKDECKQALRDRDRLLGMYGDYDFTPTVEQALAMNQEERRKLRQYQRNNPGAAFSLLDIRPGDTVTRRIGAAIDTKLIVQSVTMTEIHCGAWVFDRATGAEIDDALEWGPAYGGSGSFLVIPDA